MDETEAGANGFIAGHETFHDIHRLIQEEEVVMPGSGGDFVPLFAMLIPLSAIVLGLGLAFWWVYWNHQKRQLQYRERQLMIEKGLTPPPLLLDERTTITPEGSLRRGTILLCLGIGLAVGTAVLHIFMDDREFVGLVALAAAIVGFIGLGNLVYYFIARDRNQPERDARV